MARSDPQAVERMRQLYDGGESFAAIGRATQHDWRTVRDVLLGSGRHHGHGGRRRDVLGDRGRELLYKLIRLAPKGRSRWYARCMSKMLKKMVKPGVITNAWLNFRFSRHAMTVLYSEGVTELVVIKQHAFTAYFAERKRLDPEFEDDCVYIDVCSFNAQEIASRRLGLGPRGMPLLDHAPSDRGQNFDLAAGMNRKLGVMAPYVYEGHVDADVIELWFEKLLLPELWAGATIVLDGASYWSGKYVVEERLWPLCLKAGVSLLWLPPRSPWFNPIEKLFGWLKNSVEEDIDLGMSSNEDIPEAIHCGLDRGAPRMVARARGWIDYLFGDL